MNSDAALQILLRALPAIAVALLGLLALNDAKTRRQWAQLLYSMGSLRADQRDDPKKQSSVKWPFFALALCLLWWPVSYYRLATRKYELTEDSDLFQKKTAIATSTPTPTPKPTSVGPTPPPPPLPPGQSSPSTGSSSAPIGAAPAATPTPKPGGFHL